MRSRLGRGLKALRKRKGLSRRALAKLAYTTPSPGPSLA
jgi:transcriptional regulator with XRE-family HTH domain